MMRPHRFAPAFALAAALAAFPAAAVEDPLPGSHRDPFSQTYTGRDPEEVRAEPERDRPDAPARETSCACSREAPAQEHPPR